jgi:hypothetical protein
MANLNACTLVIFRAGIYAVLRSYKVTYDIQHINISIDSVDCFHKIHHKLKDNAHRCHWDNFVLFKSLLFIGVRSATL